MRILLAVAVFVLAAAVTVVYGAWRLAGIGTAYAAKIVCSGLFVAKRDLRSLREVDLAADDLSFLRRVEVRVDDKRREVSASLFGLAPQQAVYRDGLGCALAHGKAIGPAPAAGAASSDELKAAPQGRFDAALDWAFAEPEPSLPRRTRAVVVVHRGQVVAERYAPGFTKDTPLLGWSMTKSVANALVGVLVKEGKLSLGEPAPVAEWRGASDPRRRITLEQLLNMSSGLRFNEDYSNPLADVTYMLLGAPDAAGYAAAKPLAAEPGTRFSYSSGTTNIISRLIRQAVGEGAYHEFPRRALFDRLGMTSAVMETDAAGTFVASSFMYATARDWARFGLLYLHDGVWRGERILPEGWVAFSRKPAPAAADQRFAAHFWLGIPADYRCGEGTRPLPADAFHSVGHEGQFVSVIRSRELVVVRLGLARYPCAWDQQAFLNRVLEALEKP